MSLQHHVQNGVFSWNVILVFHSMLGSFQNIQCAYAVICSMVMLWCFAYVGVVPEQRSSPELSYGEMCSFIFLCCLHMFAKNMSESFHLTVSWPDVCSSLGIVGIFLFSSNPNNCWRQQGLFGLLQVMEQHYCLWRAWIVPRCDFFVTTADLFVLFYMAALLQVSNSLNDTGDTCSYIASGANPMFQPSHRVVGCIHSSLWMCRWAEQILESFKCLQCFLLLSLGLLIYAAWVFPVAGCSQKWCTSANRSSHRGPGSLCSYTQV